MTVELTKSPWPHIARVLLRRGRVSSTAEAFGPKWLGKKYYVPNPDMDLSRPCGTCGTLLRQAAAEGMVLLRNAGEVLPLDRAHRTEDRRNNHTLTPEDQLTVIRNHPVGD